MSIIKATAQNAMDGPASVSISGHLDSHVQTQNPEPIEVPMPSAKRAIQQAFLGQLTQQPFSRIQVKELVEHAGVARATFYLHFNSKEELLLDYCDDMFDRFFERIEGQLNLADSVDEPVARLMFATFAAEKTFSRVLTQDSVQSILLGRFQGYLARVVGHVSRQSGGYRLPPNQLTYLIDYWAGGSFLLIKQWIERDFTPGEEEMARLYSKLALSGLRALMD
ncbi:TetR/AcrR family transcriptional regulator [Marinobacter sp. SS21]|uniref:TetR/AcrR family transcriptional regulator n=1 Tax=Marinobacter sp. SS21 TaxID=2979460 RepID=UPI0023310221|nr:TetR/AcrR family transcriptional regulator [Marinobacter sp. SS21]MDC0661027.1 TetR/AcrR family transcriptional regulator [Marinobacter sp. SS21]